MQVKLFNIELHFNILNDWLIKHKLSKEDLSNIPQLGYICYEKEIPIAIGFLRMIEGGYAQIDSLVTDPEISSNLRNEAIDLVIKQLIDIAIDLKLKGICSYSKEVRSMDLLL
jgi:hypothetical protein